MDVVWMAKLQNIIFLKDSKGQSAVEYILLLAVLSSIGYAFYQNKNFKDFIKGEKGLFASLEKRMEYSYRYGRELDENVDLEDAMALSIKLINTTLITTLKKTKAVSFQV